MFALLNRFAWVIAIAISLQFSFFVDRDGPFDEGGFWMFFITLFIIKFLILPGRYIEKRLSFFADALEKRPLSGILSPGQEKEATKINKKEKGQFKEEVKENDFRYENISEKVKKPIRTKVVKKKPSKFALAVKAFFSENILAKLGGIFVFLGVLFLLSLVYSAIGPIGKLIIGFAIGFSIYFAGILLEKKGYDNEGKILLGVGILINFLVILSGRHLIGGNVDNNILTTGTTFLFLIFNTVFAVVTALVYKSRTLLLFSFIFAFINPLLVGGSSDNPYTLVGYSLIVAFGGLFISLNKKDLSLAIWVFVLSNILFLIAPTNLDIHWITKLVSSAIISISSILIIYKLNIKTLPYIFVGSYIFLILLLGSGNSYIKETTSFISYMLAIVLYFGLGVYYFLKTNFSSLIYVLFAPILIILGLSFTGGLISIVLSLAIIVLIYLLGFNFIQSKLPPSLKYIFFGILGIYIFLTNSLISLESINLDLPSFITVLIVSFLFIFTSYYLSTKKNLKFLYSLGTIGGILTLAPIIVIKNIETPAIVYLSVAGILLFAVSNWILPFINNNLIEKKENLKNLVIAMISGLLFLGFELFNYGNEYFPGVAMGFAFAILAIIYFIMAYMMMNKIGIEKVKKDDSSKNIIYSYIGVSLSVFSLAIALIFSNYPEIVSAVWLFEATIMFYFYNKTMEVKIFVAGIILFMVGIFKLFNLIDLVNSKDFVFLIPFLLIAISLVLNVKFLDFVNNVGRRVSHDTLHILGVGILAILLLEIIPSTGHGWSILGITIFISISNIIYSYYNSKILKIFFIVGFTGFLLLQILGLDSILWKIDKDEIGYLRILQYLSTALLGMSVVLWNKINKQISLNIFVNLIFALYLLIITSLYVYDIFNTTFAVTIYWGITASVLLFNGIAKDKIKLRTVGLYLIILTSLKIFGYDIWFGIDDAISRVVALIFIGILFIIISTRYTKKYGNNISGEFNITNLTQKIKSKK
ncbi:MAG: DUF2339 domain-containing protein [Candidatus Gracilibacteria bacterium]